jgi:hypothetical protein
LKITKLKVKSAPDMPPLKQFAIALELFNKKSLEYQLLIWLCEQLQAAHLSGVKCIVSGAFAPDYFQVPCMARQAVGLQKHTKKRMLEQMIGMTL